MDRLSQEAQIYNAGVFALPVPYFVGMRVERIEDLYTEGYMAFWDELDKDTDILPSVSLFLGMLMNPKWTANN